MQIAARAEPLSNNEGGRPERQRLLPAFPSLHIRAVSPLFNLTRLRELRINIAAYEWVPTPLPRLEHLASPTLSLGFFDDASWLALAEATFGANLVYLKIFLEASSALTEGGIDCAFEKLRPTLSSLQIASVRPLRPRQRLLPHFPHLSHFLVVAHHDPVDILELLLVVFGLFPLRYPRKRGPAFEHDSGPAQRLFRRPRASSRAKPTRVLQLHPHQLYLGNGGHGAGAVGARSGAEEHPDRVRGEEGTWDSAFISEPLARRHLLGLCALSSGHSSAMVITARSAPPSQRVVSWRTGNARMGAESRALNQR